ncbi:mechanosensitive ion channel family protein [Paenibacillus wulumuqiensis]|uniref:mechanosensitive ion channel family protein n=1 Tax=Paenibacillus wulumuqiensis TaxID=1567107 RepID=UPI000698E658|nr:mechanosensitive ion channel family protein [Paenibacillus wulumuqiensis]
MNLFLTGKAAEGDGITENAAKEINSFTSEFWNWFTDISMWSHIAFSALRIVIIFILTRIAIKLINKVIDRSLAGKDKTRIAANPRRLITIRELSKNVVSSVFNFIMIMLVLNEFGFNLAPLLAGAGVAGLAISFGAQSIIKDIITGFFIIFEDQFAVGDVIQTGTYKGTVQMVGLRTTRLISWNGEVNIIPNGSIISVTNFSLSNSLAVVDIPMSMDRSLEEARLLVTRATEHMNNDKDEVLDAPEILGIQTLTTGEYSLRIIAKCQPNSRADVERAIHTAIKIQLDQDKERQRLEEERKAAAEAQPAAVELQKEAADAPVTGVLKTEVNEKRDPKESNDK